MGIWTSVAVMTEPAARNQGDNRDPLLDVRGLQTFFRSGGRVVRAVDGVSIALDEAETLGIVGESGSGKSVTALSLMRLVRPPGKILSGQIRLAGRDLLSLSESEMRGVRGGSMGMIFQDPMTCLNPVLTIGRQLGETLALHLGMNRAAARARSVALLEVVRIPDAPRRIDDYPHQFSGGMRQRVMIAMAMACNPRLLIADEPTTALDVTIQAQILDLLRATARDTKTALILITHDLGVVAGMCSRTAVMYAGHVVEEAPTKELFGRPRHPYTVGLLLSIPRLDASDRSRLVPIEGQPPDMGERQVGCPFAPRCFNVQERCRSELPPLEPAPKAQSNHRVACWYPAEGESIVPSGFELKRLSRGHA